MNAVTGSGAEAPVETEWLNTEALYAMADAAIAFRLQAMGGRYA